MVSLVFEYSFSVWAQPPDISAPPVISLANACDSVLPSSAILKLLRSGFPATYATSAATSSICLALRASIHASTSAAS